MACEYNIVEAPQRTASGQRLGLEHIQPGPFSLPPAGVNQRCLVHDRAREVLMRIAPSFIRAKSSALMSF